MNIIFWYRYIVSLSGNLSTGKDNVFGKTCSAVCINSSYWLLVILLQKLKPKPEMPSSSGMVKKGTTGVPAPD